MKKTITIALSVGMLFIGMFTTACQNQAAEQNKKNVHVGKSSETTLPNVIPSKGERSDWEAQGIKATDATANPKVDEKEALDIAKKYSPKNPTEVRAFFVNIDDDAKQNYDAWIVQYRGVRVAAFSAPPSTAETETSESTTTESGIVYYDTYYVVVDATTGNVRYSFTRGFKAWPQEDT